MSGQLNKVLYYIEIISTVPEHVYNSPAYFETVTLLRGSELSLFIRDIRNKIENTLSSDNTPLSKAFTHYFEDRNEKGIPYTDFETETYQVSLIKKIINSLYHGEQALLLFEADNKSKYIAWLYIIRNVFPLIDHAYDAMHEGSQSGLEAMALIKPHLELLNTHCKKANELLPKELLLKELDFSELSLLLKIDTGASFAFKGGQFLGSMVDQIRPVKKYDYALLASLGSELFQVIAAGRNHLDKLLNEEIKNEAEEEVDEYEDIEKLKTQLNDLVDSIKKVQVNSFYNPYNIRIYVNLISNALKLINQTLYKFKYLNNSEHKIIKKYLIKLKLELICELVSMLDNIELTFVLQPGFLTKKVLVGLNEYYDLLIKKLSFVSFDNDLLGTQTAFLFDRNFLKQRENALLNKHEDISIKKNTTDKIEENAVNCFFEIFKTQKVTHLAEMPLDVKSNLVKHYFFISHYVEEIDPRLNKKIITFLNQERCQDDKSWYGFLKWSVVRVKNSVTSQLSYFDVNQEVLAIEIKLKAKIKQNQNTSDFILALIESLNTNIVEQFQFFQGKYKAFNLNKNQNTLCYFDKKALTLQPEEQSKKTTPEELFILFKTEKRKADELEKGKASFDIFIRAIKEESFSNLYDFSAEKKEMLRTHYLNFQPYLVTFFGAEGKDIDEKLVNALNPSFLGFFDIEDKSVAQTKKMNKDIFIQRVRSHFNKQFALYLKKQSDASAKSLKEGVELLLKKGDIKVLPLSQFHDRSTHLIKTKILSESFLELELQVNAYLLLLHPIVKDKLTTKAKYIPYPEVNRTDHIIPDQLLAIKQFLNIMYNIKSAIEYLEQLNDDSTKIEYAYNVLMCTGFIYASYEQGGAIRKDPYFLSLKNKVLSLSNEVYALIPDAVKESHKHSFFKYQVINENTRVIDYDKTLAPILDLFYELPMKIRCLSKSTEFSDDERKDKLDRAKLIRQRMVTLIKSSDHWGPLLLTIIEAMDIASFLKIKFNDVTYESYEAIILHLKEIKKTFFLEVPALSTPLEIKLGLKTGSVSLKIEGILVEIFNGFISQLEISENEKFILIHEVSFFNERLNNSHDTLCFIDKKIVEIRASIEITHRLLLILEEDDELNEQEFLTYLSLFPELTHAQAKQLSFSQLKKSLQELNQVKLREKETLFLDKQLNKDNLEHLRKSEIDLKKKYLKKVDDYIEEEFNKKLQTFTIKKFNQSCFDFGYEKQLFDYINSKKEKIVRNALINHSTLSSSIKYDLDFLKKEFDKINLNNYKKIHSISALLIKCRVNIESNTYSTAENKKIKRLKLKKLERITAVLDDHLITASTRLNDLKTLVDNDEFVQELRVELNHFPLSWEWFVALWDYILSLLGVSKSIEDELILEVENGTESSCKP